MNIVLYSKAGCHLCDDARLLLDELAAHVDFELDEVDIRTDDELFLRLRYRIPVISIDGHDMLEGRIDASELATVVGQSLHSL